MFIQADSCDCPKCHSAKTTDITVLGDADMTRMCLACAHRWTIRVVRVLSYPRRMASNMEQR